MAGHVGCTSGTALIHTNIHMFIKEINSQVNEQMNAGLQRIRGQLAYMTPELFIHYLFISMKNMDIQKIIKTRLFFY